MTGMEYNGWNGVQWTEWYQAHENHVFDTIPFTRFQTLLWAVLPQQLPLVHKSDNLYPHIATPLVTDLTKVIRPHSPLCILWVVLYIYLQWQQRRQLQSGDPTKWPRFWLGSTPSHVPRGDWQYCTLTDAEPRKTISMWPLGNDDTFLPRTPKPEGAWPSVEVAVALLGIVCLHWLLVAMQGPF